MKKITRKSVSILLCLLMVLSVFGGMAFTAGAVWTSNDVAISDVITENGGLKSLRISFTLPEVARTWVPIHVCIGLHNQRVDTEDFNNDTYRINIDSLESGTNDFSNIPLLFSAQEDPYVFAISDQSFLCCGEAYMNPSATVTFETPISFETQRDVYLYAWAMDGKGDIYCDAYLGKITVGGEKDIAAEDGEGNDGVVPFVVSFDAQDHGVAPENQYINSGETAVDPGDLMEDGFEFGGWYREAACETAWNFESDTVTENTVLYAKWTQIPDEEPGEQDNSGEQGGNEEQSPDSTGGAPCPVCGVTRHDVEWIGILHHVFWFVSQVIKTLTAVYKAIH